MGLIAVVLWILSIVVFFWIWSDASDRHGSSIGCLWALAVLALGPIAIIAYLIFGRDR
jgi:hypothetical protein